MGEILRQIAEKLPQLPVITRYLQIELRVGFEVLTVETRKDVTLHSPVEVQQLFGGTSMNF
jgi:hypothetical protein